MQMTILPDADAVARQAATIVAAEAREAVAVRGRFILAVSGGHTPWHMLGVLAKEALPWDSMHVVQVDERVAPTQHPDRNLTHLRDSLLAHAPLRPEHIYAMPVESAALETAAKHYARTLQQIAGVPPVLDLVHLGLGPDGHTASLVPGDPVLPVTDADVAVTGVYQGRRRMTLTYPILNRAHRILWLVTGLDKVTALARLREGDVTIPAGRIQRAAALLSHLPETPARTQHALTLHLALGAALLMTKGHAAPEVEHTYTQARALCQQMDATPELVPALFDLWRFYIARPQLQIAREFGETLLGLAQPADDPALAVIAHYALGSTWLRLGALPAARRHLEAGIARSTPDQHRAPGGRMVHELGVACRVNAVQTLWLLGYPAQALIRLREALAWAHALSHPFSRAYVRCWAAVVAQFCRDVAAVHAHAEAVGVVATAHGFLRTLTPGTWCKMRAAGVVATMQGFPLWAAMGRVLHGWALAMQGQGAEGLAQVRQGIATMQATGAALFVPYMCTLLADVAARLDHPTDGLQALTEAHTLVEQHEERWWEAEVARLRGVLLLRQPETAQAEAEAWLQRALAVARRQEAKSLELRAAMSLAHLWQQQGKRQAAHDLLAPVYGWFTEGLDTADLQEAKVLLEELGDKTGVHITR